MVAVTPLSPAGKIRDRLKLLDCGQPAFVKIDGKIGQTRLYEGLAGIKPLDDTTAERLLALVNEMVALQEAVGLPLNWAANTEKIRAAVAMRRVQRLMNEQGDHSLDQVADQAAKRLQQQ